MIAFLSPMGGASFKCQRQARLSPNSCQPELAQARLLFALGADDDAAAAYLHRARASSTCVAQADLYLAYIDELAGFRDRAKAGFYAARELADGGVFENFYDRDYDYTSPALEPDQYGGRLRKLAVFRDLLEQFQSESQGAGLEALLGPLATRAAPTPFSPEVDVRAGAAGLDLARRALDQHDFVVLRSFVARWEAAQLQGFYADLIRDGIVSNFDQDLSRTTTYNDRLSHWLGQRLTALVNRIASQPVKHVYSFLCWHRVVDGNARPVLKPHTDREDNDWTVSIQLHYDDDGRGGSWPIWVHKPRQAVEKAGWQQLPPRSESVQVALRDGDAILFRGRRHIHWRDPMPEPGRSYSSLLLHYVPNEFDWHDFKFVRQIEDPAI